MDEGTHRSRQASAPQRLLRPAARADLSAPQRLSELHRLLTDGSFRATHEQQRDETRRLLDRARENNHVRLVEVLERDEASLTNIIDGLNAIDGDHHFDGDEIDLLALADERSGEVA